MKASQLVARDCVLLVPPDYSSVDEEGDDNGVIHPHDCFGGQTPGVTDCLSDHPESVGSFVDSVLEIGLLIELLIQNHTKVLDLPTSGDGFPEEFGKRRQDIISASGEEHEVGLAGVYGELMLGTPLFHSL